MRVKAVVASIAAVLVGAVIPSLAQEEPPTFAAGTELVVLDMVVRDKGGRLITDLAPDEVRVFEDGVECKIESLRLVRAGRELELEPGAPSQAGDTAISAPTASGKRSEVSAEPMRQSIVVLAFDELGPESASVARRAAREFVKRIFPQTTWFGVYRIHRRLTSIQGFTQDRAVLPDAIDRATTGGEQPEGPPQDPNHRSGTEEALSTAKEAAAMELPQGAAAANYFIAQMEAAVLLAQDELTRQMRGSNSLYSLLALARGLQGVRGRKTLLYFSEGLQVPFSTEGALDSVVSQSNRSNLAVYSLDARGLLTTNLTDNTRTAMETAAKLSERAHRSSGGTSVAKLEIKGPDLALDALRMNVQENMRELAERTGGFLLGNTNDLAPGLDKIGADLGTYYEIGYAPVNPEADGKFRRIEVKVARQEITVRTRSGYFALPPGAKPALPYELALAQALELKDPPLDFDHSVFTQSLGSPDGKPRIEVLVRVPLRALHFEYDQVQRIYQAHLSALVVIRNPTGEPVAKLSHDWPLAGPLMEAPSVRARLATIERTLELRAGTYILETVVQDRLTGRLSVHKTPLEVAP